MYKLVLAICYLLKRRISYFALVAVSLCVFVALIVITVLSGLNAEFRKKTYASVGDCVVSTKSLVGFAYYESFIDKLEKEQIVEAVSPVIRSYALVSGTSPVGRNIFRNDYPKEIVGIDPVRHSKVTDFGRWLYFNKQDPRKAFTQNLVLDFPGCVPGIGLLFDRDSDGNYKVPSRIPNFRIEVSCFPLNAKGALAKAGAGVVNTKTFYFSDTVQSGVKGDWTRLYLPLEQAQVLCGMATATKRISAIHVKFKTNVRSRAGCDKVKALWTDFVKEKADAPFAALLKKVKVQNWEVYSRDIIAVAETQQSIMIFCFAMIGLITIFIVFVVVYMVVSHKTKDIGILKSIGTSDCNILSLFLIFSLSVGVIGSALGAIGGWQFLVHINRIEDWLFRHFQFQLFDRTMYAIGDIPNNVDLKVLGIIVLSAIVACLLGAIVPGRQAAKLDPVQALQVNQL